MMTLDRPEWKPDDLARWSGGGWLRPPESILRGVSSDTRTLEAGTLYIALRGERFDGHDYVEDAIARGAAGALVETQDLTRYPATLPLLVVDDTRTALTALAAGYREELNAFIVGVTGSVGKTTVKELIADALAAAAPTFRSPGNWNNDLGVPLSLLGMRPDHVFGVFELGMNRPGEIGSLARLLRPSAGVMTTLGPVHLEAFGTEQAIVEEKSDLFKQLPADGWAVVSRDGPWFDLMQDIAPCPLVTTSMERDADYTATVPSSSRFEVLERESGERREFEAALPGRYFAENILLAVAVARGAGVGWDILQRAVQRFRSQPMRWETTCCGGVTVINDAYNANPVSMREALKAFLAMPVRGERWLVLGGMHELGSASDRLHRDLGRFLGGSDWAGFVVCGEVGKAMADGAREGGLAAERIHVRSDHAAAANVLAGALHEGDAVLFKASRGERFEELIEAWGLLQPRRAGADCAVAGGEG